MFIYAHRARCGAWISACENFTPFHSLLFSPFVI